MLITENMIEIKILYKQGKSIRTIAKGTGFSKNTVKKHLHRTEPLKYKRRTAKLSKLEKHKKYIETRVKDAKPHVLPFARNTRARIPGR